MMEKKQFYTISIFSIVAIIGMVLLVMGVATTETGMAPFTFKRTYDIPQPFKSVPYEPPRFIAPSYDDMGYRVCIGSCNAQKNVCLAPAEEVWLDCMSRNPTDVCEPAMDAARKACSSKFNACKSRCDRFR
jgi:hypothetical protein